MPPEAEPTLYEWAGGTAAFERWLNAFYDLLELDEELVAMFGGRVSEEHRRHVVAWWAEVMGGPATYTDELGGYERMLAHHRGLQITPEQRLRFVTLLSQAADVGGAAGGPRVPRGADGLRRVGVAAGAAQLGPRRRRGHLRAGAPLGLGRGAPLPALATAGWRRRPRSRGWRV